MANKLYYMPLESIWQATKKLIVIKTFPTTIIKLLVLESSNCSLRSSFSSLLAALRYVMKSPINNVVNFLVLKLNALLA